MRPTAVLICPGRGTYNKAELGTLGRFHAGNPLIATWDAMRADAGQQTLTALDSAQHFAPGRHTTGDNASALIYACSYLDAQAALQSHDVKAVTGNSLGWYIALAAGGSTDAIGGLTIVNTMGTLMHRHGAGGQILYPFVDEDWRPIGETEAEIMDLIARIDGRPDHRLALSIHLGGMLVVAGNDAGLDAFADSVPSKDGRYPLRLPNHAAFHTDMLAQVAEMGRAALGPDLFCDPHLPLIDGRGSVWWPKSSDIGALRGYTLDTQITRTCDFTAAIQSAARNFAPYRFIVTGPGTTLGSAVAQSLIAINWQGIDSKAAFMARQARDPLVVSMGRPDQRPLVLGDFTTVEPA
nr:ACP S-malonyltransferase [uncultured Sulfitobacter sp.]